MTAHDIQPWLDRVVEVCRPDERVIAVLLLGSHAAGRADRYSDIDIGLVTTDAGLEAVVAELPDIVRRLGEPLFDEDFDDPSNRHVIYADGTCLEIMAWSEGESAIQGPHRVLFDRATVADRLVSAAPGTTESATANDATEVVRRRIVWFWHDVEHLITALGRGQTWWAYGQLDILRGVCLDLARLADGVEVEPGEAYWKVDASLAAPRLAALASTFVPREPERILAAAHDLIGVYRGVAEELAQANGIAYPHALDDLISGQLPSLADGRHDPGPGVSPAREPLGPEALDFWLGTWDLTWADGGRGRNTIRRILDDRVIEESFVDHASENALLGRSVSVRDSADGRWHQTWVDSTGGWIELVGVEADGRISFQREFVRDGIAAIQRMVWLDVTDASFRWEWQRSRDGGTTWEVIWAIDYRRAVDAGAV